MLPAAGDAGPARRARDEQVLEFRWGHRRFAGCVTAPGASGAGCR